MQGYKAEFIEFLVRAGVLTFGDFVTKSGRKTPYFINTGNYRTGRQLCELGEFYGRALAEQFGDELDNLYGPAYKGIPLAVAAGIALGRDGRNVTVTYNRKEFKDHGEKGCLIGHQYAGDERVVIVEDVITAGTSIRESVDILKANNSPKLLGAIVSVDRAERGKGQLSAIDEVKEQFDLQIVSIVTVKEIISYLHNRPIDSKIYIDDAVKMQMESYLAEYGA